MYATLAVPDTSTVGSTGGALSAPVVPYTRIPDAVLLDPRLTPVQFRVYAVIARRADRETASAFPSYATIAKDASVSRMSAINGVKALVSLGYLSKQAQESGQGDPTSNLYIVSGEGSQIFVLPRSKSTAKAADAVQNLDCGRPEFGPQAVQPLDRGGPNAAPESDSANQKQKNKIQENQDALARTRETSAAAAPAIPPQLEAILADFRENIGPLTSMARQVIVQLAEANGVERVRNAIQEAVIYEKRSLAYVRRVLRAWQRDGRATGQSRASLTTASRSSEYQNDDHATAPTLIWPPPDLNDDLPTAQANTDDPAVAAWDAVSQQLPQLGRLTKGVTPVSLVGDVLTVSVSDERTYSVLTTMQRHLVDFTTREVLGDEAKIHVVMVKREADEA